MLYSLAIVLPGNMTKNKDFLLTKMEKSNLNCPSTFHIMCQKLWWQEFTDVVFVHRIFMNRYTDLRFQQWLIHFHNIRTRTWSSRIPSLYRNQTTQRIDRLYFFLFVVRFMWNKSWHTHVGNTNRSAPANSVDRFLLIWRIFSASLWSECPVTSFHRMWYSFLVYCILVYNLQCTDYNV